MHKTQVRIPGAGRPPGEGNGKPLQYPYLGNPMDRGAWQVTVRGTAESDTTEHAHARAHTCTFPLLVHSPEVAVIS